MQVHIFRGTGRVFGFIPIADSETLPAHYGPWAVFRTLDMAKGEVRPG